MSKTTHCPSCKIDIVNKYWNFHLKSKKHLKNGGDNKVPENILVKQPVIAKQQQQDVYDGDDDNTLSVQDDDNDYIEDNYLAEFDNIPLKVEEVREPTQKTTDSNDKLRSLFYKHTAKKHTPVFVPKRQEDDVMSVMSDELFSRKSTPILGKSYR